jgi:RNA polymerase sigma factor (sigma-70 family)
MPNTVAQTFSEYRERLLKFIRSRVRRLEDAEAILSDVFYQYANINSIINPIENTTAWLYKVARHRIIDHQKKKKDEPLPAHYDEDEDDYIVDEIADIIYGEDATPETKMIRSLLLGEIQTAISELPKEQREVFEMTELLDFSVKEVAEKTKTPVNTVLSRKHYAVKHLRKRLEEMYTLLMKE